MKYLLMLGSSINEFLGSIYATLTEFFQTINLDSHLAVFCEYNILVCFIAFALILPYFIFFDKEQTAYNFANPKNIVIMLFLFGVYYLLENRPVNLSAIGLGTITINPFLLIIVAKLYGAIPAAAFGVAEYFLACITSPNDPLMFGLFFIYAIGGLIHGFFLYNHRTSFWRCLVSRIVTVVFCNIILLSFVRAGTYAQLELLSIFIPQTITSNILQIPIQAFVGYVFLRLIKILRKRFDF